MLLLLLAKHCATGLLRQILPGTAWTEAQRSARMDLLYSAHTFISPRLQATRLFPKETLSTRDQRIEDIDAPLLTRGLPSMADEEKQGITHDRPTSSMVAPCVSPTCTANRFPGSYECLDFHIRRGSSGGQRAQHVVGGRPAPVAPRARIHHHVRHGQDHLSRQRIRFEPVLEARHPPADRRS